MNGVTRSHIARVWDPAIGHLRRTTSKAPTLFAGRLLLCAVALGVGLQSLFTARASSIGQYGIIQALPPTYFCALLVLLAAFILSWTRDQPAWHEVLIEVAVLLILLQAPASIIEPEPRFPVAWLTVGFTDHVARTGHVLPELDARFNWPSFFAGVALLTRTAGFGTSLALIKIWPLLLNALYLGPIGLIAHRILGDRRRTMLVLWLWPMANWVGQDYFSPQSVAYLLYLTFVAIVLGPLGRRAPLRFLFWGGGASAERAPEPLAPSTAAALLGSLLVLDFAMATGHQLTPIFAAVALVVLWLIGRTRLRLVAAVACLLAIGWICYGAYPFWSGHLGLLFGTFGTLTGNVSADLASRLTGSPAHHFVVDVRLLESALLWAAGLLALAWRRGHPMDRPLACALMLFPFVLLPTQSYGGEAGLRVFLFSLPGALPLVASLLVRNWRIGYAPVGIIASALLVPLFLVAEWGNELTNMVRPADVAAVRALYRVAPKGSTFVSLDEQVTWSFKDIAKYQYQVNIPQASPAATARAMQSAVAHDSHGGYVVITSGQVLDAEQLYGLPASWAKSVERRLVGTRHFRLIIANAAARIYKYEAK